MNAWYSYTFLMIGWIGGTVMASSDGLIAKVIITVITMLVVYPIAIVVIKNHAMKNG